MTQLLMLQVNENSLNKKGHIGIVEKVQETSSNTGIYSYMTLCAYAITIYTA